MHSTSSNPTLYYIHDPMCSWCWGFRPVWQQVQAKLPSQIKVQYVLGGLAPDSDNTMPQDMQINIATTWQTIQREIPGTQFN
ncbi:MAG: DsbA family protein, partial [Gammaproteobacteria bacterium]|nr:DsbA family protein [Gammaproteobacteria bacterium]